MWTLWGNVYTLRDDGGSDSRTHWLRSLRSWNLIKGVHLDPFQLFFAVYHPFFNPKIFAATRRQGGGWLDIGAVSYHPRDPLVRATIRVVAACSLAARGGASVAFGEGSAFVTY